MSLASWTCQRQWCQWHQVRGRYSLAQWQVQLASDIKSEGATVLGTVHCTVSIRDLPVRGRYRCRWQVGLASDIKTKHCTRLVKSADVLLNSALRISLASLTYQWHQVRSRYRFYNCNITFSHQDKNWWPRISLLPFGCSSGWWWWWWWTDLKL